MPGGLFQQPDRSSGRPVIGVAMGDPRGIGPEVIVKALADPARRARARFVIFGSKQPMAEAAGLASIDGFWSVRTPVSTAGPDDGVVLLDYGEGDGTSSQPEGELSFRFIDDAIAATGGAAVNARGDAPAGVTLDAIVTGPINKEAWAEAGHAEFPGHTELLADRFGAKRVRMMFVAPKLRVVLATTHIPLARVPAALSVERVRETIELGAEACESLGIAGPRIAVCGVNPHAGEGGLLGDEDTETIAPAVQAARTMGIDASGPWPGDTIWNAAVAGKYDLVVAMYHDQGLIPVKLLAFHDAVNVTVGLPVPRTSPDHGTAFDIAGKNIANPGSMAAAIDLAITLARSRGLTSRT
ncbi:MAG TPA: 4-hydroxythreonine-4-phosphate dehydrogenase PdxA [Phycisphaerales bacterium]|nr:4-hydroxythreonine-4-phosphate dehydrogenase PdxA [Phycisphaerales bacterium]